MIRIRPHHLLCMSLFAGEGYSAAFVGNMRSIIGALSSDPGSAVLLAAGCDDICAHCPHLTLERACSLGDDDVLSRDRRVLDALALRDGGIHAYADVVARIMAGITRESFDACCGRCRWHEAGLCSFDALMNKLID